MKIACIGDVHGNTDEYVELVKGLDCNLSVQLGDMGLGFRGISLPALDPKHVFIRGNHDDVAVCRAHPNYLGDYGVIGLTEHLMVIGDKLPPNCVKIFFLGGAYSIDNHWRRVAQTASNPLWWPDEELSEDELQKAGTLYLDVKPDIVLSHECPRSANEELLSPLLAKSDYYIEKMVCADSRTCDWLEKMLALHQPKKWVFGHYHVDRTFTINGTVFQCVPELGVHTIAIGD